MLRALPNVSRHRQQQIPGNGPGSMSFPCDDQAVGPCIIGSFGTQTFDAPAAHRLNSSCSTTPMMYASRAYAHLDVYTELHSWRDMSGEER